MKCCIVNAKGIDQLQLVERETPHLHNARDVRVKVKACSLNYRDLMIARGEYFPNKGNESPFIPVSDFAGEVVEVGSEVTEWKVGDRVINHPFRKWPAGTLRLDWATTFIGVRGMEGILAEEVVYPSDALVAIPHYLSDVEASTFPIAGLTAWSALVTHGRLLPGEWVLLEGTGGVSIFAAQLAHAMGAKTILLTSSTEKASLVKSKFLVHSTLNYKQEDWPKKVKEITQGKGVDIIVDVAGGNTFTQALKVCNFSARVAVIGVLGGAQSSFDVADLLRKQIKVQGIFMESAQELRALMRAAESLALKPCVDKVFPFNETQAAYRYLESQKHIGKVVITLP